MGDLLADERCSPAVVDFLRSTYVGRTAPPVEENWDSEDEAEAAEDVAEADEVRSKRSGGPWASGIVIFLMRVRLIFLCNFLGAIQRRRRCRRARPSGRDGRQEQDSAPP